MLAASGDVSVTTTNEQLFLRQPLAVVAVPWPEKGPSRNVKEYRKLRRFVKREREATAVVTGRFARTIVHFGDGATLDFRLELQMLSDVIAMQ